MNNKYILIVEDNAEVQDCLVWVLEDAGYSIMTAKNGQEGLAILKKNSLKLALIILDMMLPILNGFEFREIKNSNVRLKKIPIIFLTGRLGLEKDFELALNEFFVPKPFHLDTLLRLVKRLIASS